MQNVDSSSSGSNIRKKLLIVTTEYFHPTRFRLHYFLPYLRETFDIRIIAIASLTHDLSPDKYEKTVSRKRILFGLRRLAYILTKMTNENTGELVVLRTPFPGVFPRWLYELLTTLFAALVIRVRGIHRGFDACLATMHFAGFCALLAKMPLPIIYEDVDRCEYNYRGALARRISRFVEGYCIRNSTQVISAGYALAASAQLLRGKKVHCVPNGADLKLFEDSEISTVAEDRSALVYVGILDNWSGLDVAIKAFALISSSFPDARLNIAGRGALSVKLRKLVTDLHVDDRVSFMGHVKYESIPQLLLNSGIGLATFLDSPLVRYAFAIKLVEYMAAGLPIIATDVGDTGRIVREAKCGLLVDTSDPTAISEAMIKLLEDRNLAEMFSRNGRNYVKRFDLKCLGQQEIEIIMNTIKQ